MGNDETFELFKGEKFQYGLLLNAVIQDAGLDQAMDIVGKASEAYATAVISMLKQQLGEAVAPEVLVGAISSLLGSTGFESEIIKENPKTVVLKTKSCPAYEGMLMAGLEPETIEAYCRKITETYAPYFKQLNPKLNYRLRTWAAPDHVCEEEFSLA